VLMQTCAKATETCDPYSENCSMDNYDVLKITCMNNAERLQHPNCGCAGKDPEELKDCEVIDVTGYTHATLTEATCRELCEKQALLGGDKKCSRWLWTKEERHIGDYVECTMRSDPCPGPLSCTSDLKECVSGQINCEEAAPPSCNGNISYDPSSVHWHCWAASGYVNVYQQERIPVNTRCKTMKRCSAWNEGVPETTEASVEPGTTTDLSSTEPSTTEPVALSDLDYRLVVRCNREGDWEADEDTGDKAVTESLIQTTMDGDKNTTTIIEANMDTNCLPSCPPTKLDENELNKSGVKALCMKDLSSTEYVLQADNSCILLCDNKLQKSIGCLFDPSSRIGGRTWLDETRNNFIYNSAQTEFKCSLKNEL